MELIHYGNYFMAVKKLFKSANYTLIELVSNLLERYFNNNSLEFIFGKYNKLQYVKKKFHGF